MDFEMRLFWITWVSLNVIVNDLIKERQKIRSQRNRFGKLNLGYPLLIFKKCKNTTLNLENTIT